MSQNLTGDRLIWLILSTCWWDNEKWHQVLFQARQLVKDGFLVEVSESSRKLRHVFLFTDLLLCAKMKKTAVGWVYQTSAPSSFFRGQKTAGEFNTEQSLMLNIQSQDYPPRVPICMSFILPSTSAHQPPDSETERMTPALYKRSRLSLFPLLQSRRAFWYLANKENDWQAFCPYYFDEWRGEKQTYIVNREWDWTQRCCSVKCVSMSRGLCVSQLQSAGSKVERLTETEWLCCCFCCVWHYTLQNPDTCP